MHACRLRGRQQKRREKHKTTVSHSQQSRGKWCSNLLSYIKSRLQLASSLHFLACPPSVCYPFKCSLDLYWSAIEMDVLAVFQKTNQKKLYYFRSKEPFEAFFPLWCVPALLTRQIMKFILCEGDWLWGWAGREQMGILLDQHLHSGLSLIKDIWVLLRRKGGGQWWLSLPPILSLPLSPSFISQKQNSRVGLSWSALRETSGWRAHEWRRVAGVPLVT